MSKLFIGALRLDIFIPQSHSLKDKRRIVKSLIDATRAKYNVSAAQVEGLELWQRGILGFAYAGISETAVKEVFQRIMEGVERNGEIEVLRADMEIFRIPHET